MNCNGIHKTGECGASIKIGSGAALTGGVAHGVVFVNSSLVLDEDVNTRLNNGTAVALGRLSIAELTDDIVTLGHYDHMSAATVFGLRFDASGKTTLNSVSGQNLDLAIAGTSIWRVTSAGHLIAVTDGNNDIGASAATRPRTLYLSTSAIVNAVQISGSTQGLIVPVSGNAIGMRVQGRLAVGSTSTDVEVNTDTTRTAGRLFAVLNNGTRVLGVMSLGGRLMYAVPNSAPTDADLQNNEVSWYINEATPSVLARIRKSDGTYLLLTITNGASPTLA